MYALKETTGQLLWKFDMGDKQAYPWRFDYFYSSPTLYENKLIIGGDDGYLHMLNQSDGKQFGNLKAMVSYEAPPRYLIIQLCLVTWTVPCMHWI